MRKLPKLFIRRSKHYVLILRLQKGGAIMAQQLHKKFTNEQVKDLMKRYINGEIERKYLQEVFGIKKTRFFALVGHYKSNPDNFSIQYIRANATRSIAKDVETNILKELTIDKNIIKDNDIPLKKYNYSYVKNRLEDKYKQKVSLSTIINRAKRYNFYIKKRLKKALHDREILTNYTGQLIQHDSSHHLWAPASNVKWYLITSLDDYSRYMFYAKLVEHETTWTHITALQSLVLKYGIPHSYYVDSHRIFRFVQGRDSLYHNHYKLTDTVDPQWKQVTRNCNINVVYALSPQAKGKIERPYRWLQDRLIRTCVRENISKINHAQNILNKELERYNCEQVHSTTLEIPYYRFQRALQEKKSLFRSFAVQPPFQSVKDIFCLHAERTTDAYRKISIDNLQLKVNNVNPYKKVTIKIYPLSQNIAELRFWHNNQLVDVYNVKITDLPSVHF